MRYHDLGALPEDHALRNAPLGTVGAQYRKDDSWHTLERSYAIFSFTYNQLGIGWLNTDWRAPEQA